MHTREEKLEAFGRFLDILDTLREKCPWDRKQSNESLRPNTLEEVYELCDALLNGDSKAICKELGDVLLHIAFYAKIASEKEQFDIADVCNSLSDKLMFRHPHIYANTLVSNADEVAENWEQIKLKEKDGNKTVLSGVPEALPSLIKAYRIQDKARNVGFDWDQRDDVWLKVQEELQELQIELNSIDKVTSDEQKEKIKARMEDEFGDFLFSIINAGRLYQINPDNALEGTNQKFIRRFNHVESRATEMHKSLKEMSIQEMELLWQEAKKQESKSD